MTAAQKQARARFAKAQKIAKELRKKNAKLTQAQAVKQAFAIIYKKPVKKAAKKAVKKAVKKVVRKKVGAVKTKSKTHTDYNKPTVNIQIGAMKRGSSFSGYKGFLIEKKPVVIGKKKTHVFICAELDIADKTLSKVKSRINYLSK